VTEHLKIDRMGSMYARKRIYGEFIMGNAALAGPDPEHL
jgi:hypothetical protein